MTLQFTPLLPYLLEPEVHLWRSFASRNKHCGSVDWAPCCSPARLPIACHLPSCSTGERIVATPRLAVIQLLGHPGHRPSSDGNSISEVPLSSDYPWSTSGSATTKGKNMTVLFRAKGIFFFF